jgi:hypothetical protein
MALVSSMLENTSRRLPRGWKDLAWQFVIWFGFLAVYQIARGLAGHQPARAFANGLRVVQIETHLSDRLYELTLQQFVSQRFWLADLVSWTYWNSEFTVLGLTLLWVYFRRHDLFYRFRNTVLLANVIGLFGYVFMPTAPPRLLDIGFVNDHTDGLVRLAANPYAAMPSLHAADSLIVGVFLAMACKHWWAKAFWIAWPAWVWFAVMATGNHFWLDCVAGMIVALVALAIVGRGAFVRTLAVRRA